MALEALRAEGAFSHHLKHDLKSFFYVLLFICVKYKGPGTKRTNADLEAFQLFGIQDWFVWDSTFKQLADSKVSQMTHFDCEFITKLDPYFEDLKDCLTSMYNTIFTTKNFWENTANHPVVLRILQETYNKLPDEGLASNEVTSQVSSSKGVSLSMC